MPLKNFNTRPPSGQIALNANSAQADGLLAWWPMVGGRPELLRDRAGRYDVATSGGTSAIVSDVQRGEALSASNNDYLKSVSGVTFPRTLSCWINPSSLVFGGIPLGYSGSARDLSIRLNSSGQASAISALTPLTSASSSTGVITTGSWFHAVAVFASRTSRKIYVNGTLLATDTADDGGSISGLSFVHIATSSYTGRLADARIYARALDAAAISAMFRNPWDMYRAVKRPARGWKSTLLAATRHRRPSTSPPSPSGWIGVRTASPQASGLLAWYPAAGQRAQSLRDYGGRGTLSPTNTPTIVSDGTRGVAMNFVKASSQYYSTTTMPVQNMPFTLSCWFNLTTLPSAGGVGFTLMSMGRTDVNLNCFALSIAADNTPQAYAFQNGTGTNEATNGPSTVAAGSWHHLAAVFTFATRKLYLDGALVGSGTATFSDYTTNVFTLGCFYFSGTIYNYSDAKLADARVYSGNKDAAFIADLFRKPWDLYDTLLTRRKVGILADSAPTSTFRFRRTFGRLGTRTGSRQVM